MKTNFSHMTDKDFFSYVSLFEKLNKEPVPQDSELEKELFLRDLDPWDDRNVAYKVIRK